MAEQVEQEQVAAQAQLEDDDDEMETPGYKAPSQKTMDEIKELDKEDESLNKYKQALMGSSKDIIVDNSNPKRVILKKLTIVTEEKTIEMDMEKVMNDREQFKVVLKEGCEYRVQIDFYVQRDIVSGLKFFQTVSRKGIKVEKTNYMIGSRAPGTDLKTYTTEPDTLPSGMLARGEYKVKSKVLDDDKNVHMEWEWHILVKKDYD